MEDFLEEIDLEAAMQSQLLDKEISQIAIKGPTTTAAQPII